MTNRIQTLRSSIAGNRPSGRLPGELYVNWPDGQLGVINAINNPQDLIAVRFFSTGASYNVGDHVIQSGALYKALVPVSPGVFNPTQWGLAGGGVTVGDTPPTSPQIGSLWWDSVGGQLYVWYNDGSSSQWVVANNEPALSQYLPLSGGTLTGPLTGTAATFTSLSAPQAIGDNRIINGDMRIDQRNNGASGTAQNVYTVDRWFYGASQASKGAWERWTGDATALATGINYALLFLSSSAYTPVAGDYFFFRQIVEADVVTDFSWGTPNAKPATLSFWANSSLGGTFGGAIQNSGSTRSYPFTFTLPPNAWTKIAITILGDTTGAWGLSGNGAGISICFSLGAGATYSGPANVWAATNYLSANGAVSVVATNGAAFYLTGVKLEIGSVATPFNRQTMTKSLADCQRYYQSIAGAMEVYGYGAAAAPTSVTSVMFKVTMRAAPVATIIGTPTYTNCSALSLASANSNVFTPVITVTAVGAFLVTFNAGFDAEL